jgi:hypothetical protein
MRKTCKIHKKLSKNKKFITKKKIMHGGANTICDKLHKLPSLKSSIKSRHKNAIKNANENDNTNDTIIQRFKNLNPNSDITNNEILELDKQSKIIEKETQIEVARLEQETIKANAISRRHFNRLDKHLPLLINNLIANLNYIGLSTNPLIKRDKIKYPKILVENKAFTIETSGSKNDCLIHSILICVSKEFRHLSLNDKNFIAHYFRRYILPQTQSFNADKIKVLKSEDFLQDDILEKINEYYNINIISVVDTVTGQQHTGQVVSVYALETPKPNCFLIHNVGNRHFSAIYLKKTKSFEVPLDIVEELIKLSSHPDQATDRQYYEYIDRIMLARGYRIKADSDPGPYRYIDINNDDNKLDFHEAEALINQDQNINA